MKKISVYIGILYISFLMIGCNQKSSKDNPQPSITATQTLTPTNPIATQLPAVTQGATPTTVDAKGNEVGTIEDYYPFEQNTESFYEGEGNEFASFQTYTDFIDDDNQRMQLRINNGGTVLVQVIENKEGKLSVNYTKGECYYRDNFMEVEVPEENTEIILMEPLRVGTEWNLPDGRRRYISNINVDVNTPLGTFQALEVTTEEIDSTTREYYAPNMGLIKRMVTSEDMLVTSTLRERNPNVSFTQLINVYYPDNNETLVKEQKTITFYTNDVTRMKFQEVITEQVKEGYLSLASVNTKINAMYLGEEDGIAYIDFSKDLVRDMNVGGTFENLILQSITNTIGNYYGVEKVYITVEGEPYESGHFKFKKGETFNVTK